MRNEKIVALFVMFLMLLRTTRTGNKPSIDIKVIKDVHFKRGVNRMATR